MEEKSGFAFEPKVEVSRDSEAFLIPRPKVAVVIDSPTWAFANIASQVSKHLSLEFEIRTIPVHVLDDFLQLWFLVRDCDLVHFLWGNYLLETLNTSDITFQNRFGISRNKFFETFVQNKKLTIGIFDHLHLDEESMNNRKDLYNSAIAGYTVSSLALKKIYDQIAIYPPPSAITQDGVDLQLFNNQSSKLDDIENRPLRVGWVGNSGWGQNLNDPKGLVSILKPALQMLKQKGKNIDFILADRSVKMIPREEMPDYYRKIDVLICSSSMEGTPNPVLEAMATGCAIISTRVGIVPEVFGLEQQKFILTERSPDKMAEAIEVLDSDRNLIRKLSEENLRSVQAWSWERQSEKYARFFRKVLSAEK